MMNDYFQFKQFTIFQDKCAQKVSEIACIFGAYVPICPETKNILDIGAGTGLLSLMIAQRYNAAIDAIEIETNAFEQMTDNIIKSPFAHRINCIYADAVSYQYKKQYDMIICNPPFFANSLKSKSDAKNKAWHDDTLNIEKLISLPEQLLTDEGMLHILFPSGRVRNILDNKLHIRYIQPICHEKNKNAKFEILGLSKKYTKTENHFPLILKDKNEYTPETKKLLKEYYLYL